ncbi:MAG: hypothetical protein ACTS2F_07290 [Thainema sp.]
MDSVQKQILALNTKVDALHQVIEQINVRVLDAISAQSIRTGNKIGSEAKGSADFNSMSYLDTHPHFSGRGLDEAFGHKDILSDGDYFEADSPSHERDIDPAIQIQRLTAQLTAAYNRIAALEEQLLARRVL